jgi:predicted metal-dependent peptidase
MTHQFKQFEGMSETAVRLLLRTPYIMPLYYSMNILEIRDDPEMETLATDGINLWVNPAFWNQLDREQRLTALAHEIGHKMLLHSTRRYERNPYVWNLAGDYMINPMLVQSKFAPLTNLVIDGKPWSWLYNEKYVDPKWTTETIYDDIIKEFENGQKGKAPSQAGSGAAQGGSGIGKPVSGQPTGVGGTQPDNGQSRAGEHAKKVLGPFHDLRDFGTNPDGSKADNTPSVETHEQNVRKEVKEAEAQAKMIGSTPAWIERVIGTVMHAKVNWHEVLEQYLRGLHQSDYSWSRMNRRDFIKTGVISPDMYQPAMGGVLKFIDTSGSVSARELALYDRHMKDVLEQVRPKWTALAYWDTMLHRLDRFERSEYELDSSMMKPVGGGGTDFRGWQNVIDELDEPPEIVLAYTDMYATFPRQELSVPIIWLSTSSITAAPFGRCIAIN